MRIAKCVLARLLACLTLSVVVAPAWGQATEFKGEAKVNVHTHKLEKGSTYRLTAKGDGFVPRVWIDSPGSGTFANLGASGRGGVGNQSQVIFTPAQTRDYRIKVDYPPGLEMAKGPLSYSLAIERAVFKPRLPVEDSQLEISEQTRKLEQGKVYSITVTGTGFAAEVQIADGNRPVARAFNGRWFGFGPDSEFVTTLTFAPPRTLDYRVVILVGPITEKREGPLAYTMEISEVKVTLSVNEQLTKEDPIYPRRGGPHKTYPVKLQAGNTYQIDMTSHAFDAYLFVEDSAGKVVAEDDDSGGSLNARIVFRATKTDTYRVVATTFGRGATGPSSGPFSLTVVDNPQVQPRFSAPAVFDKVLPKLQN